MVAYVPLPFVQPIAQLIPNRLSVYNRKEDEDPCPFPNAG